LRTILDARYLIAGICTMTCHKAHNIFDVVPGDVVGSVILATAAATVQVCPHFFTQSAWQAQDL